MKFCNTRHVHESTKSQAWRAFLFTCFACLHTCVLTCLTCFPAHALICLVHSRVYMLVCLICLCAYVFKSSASLHAYVLVCLRDHVLGMLTCTISLRSQNVLHAFYNLLSYVLMCLHALCPCLSYLFYISKVKFRKFLCANLC